MFGFGKKKDEEKKEGTLENALSDAERTMARFKHFIGKDSMKEMTDGIALARQVQSDMQQAQTLAQAGLDATAVVSSIQDTGRLINFDPVVVLGLKVTPAQGAAFDAVGQVKVSKIAVPRVGDNIRIKYDGTNPSQFVVVS